MFIRLAYQSLIYRKQSVLLTIASIAISVTLLLGVGRLQEDAKKSFQNTVSNIDLIVGAKTGSTQLLLSTVFHHGFPSNNISYKLYTQLKKDPEAAFVLPISLGDSHRGFRVVGTTPDFFDFFQYGPKIPLAFEQGTTFNNHKGVVLGAWVAQTLGYQINQPITVSHGLGQTSFANHDAHPFTVTGILQPTGTPVDRALYVDLSAIEWIHQDNVEDFVASPPVAITAMFIGLQSKLSIFEWQRWFNTYPNEALLAILPSLTLYEMWSLISMAEKTLMLVSMFVFIAAMLGLLIALLSSMKERRYEMAVLRSQGAHPWYIASLFILETILISTCAIIVGLLTLNISLRLAAPFLQESYGLFVRHGWVYTSEWIWLGALLGASIVFSLIPSVIAYRQSLRNGLQA